MSVFPVNLFCTTWQTSGGLWHICIWEMYLPHKRRQWLKSLVYTKERWAHELIDGSYLLELLSHVWTATHQGVLGNLQLVATGAWRLPLGIRVSYCWSFTALATCQIQGGNEDGQLSKFSCDTVASYLQGESIVDCNKTINTVNNTTK